MTVQREVSGAVMSDARMYGKTATRTRRGARLLQRGDEVEARQVLPHYVTHR